MYNNYAINWVGSNDTFFNIGPLSDINSDQVFSTVKIANVGSSSNISPQNNETGKGIDTKVIGNSSVATSSTAHRMSDATSLIIIVFKRG